MTPPPRLPALGSALCLAASAPRTSPAGTPSPAASAHAINPWQITTGPVQTTFSLAGTLQATPGFHAFWGLADTFAADSQYPKDHFWAEGYLRLGLRSAWTISPAVSLYAGLAAVASGTAGDDYFMTGSTGRVLMEDAFAGITWKSGTLTADVSTGMQPYTIGHSLLIGVGGGNGFERGAAAIFPRKSWEQSAIARFSAGPWQLDGFWINAHELDSADSGTELAGTRLAWNPSAQASLGAAWFTAVRSASPYPASPVGLIPDGRDGLQTFDVFGQWSPQDGAMEGFSLRGEIAFQYQNDISQRAFGGGLELGYQWKQLTLQPRLSYSPRYFSGDDPNTTDRFERFDPLFYDGGPATWSSGSASSFALYNANVVSHRVRLELTLSPSDFVNLNYWYSHAAETGSPIQFGQAARIVEISGSPALVSGVPRRGLAHDLWLEHTHACNDHWYLSWGIAASFPGSGIRAITRNPADWWGGLVNVTFRY